MVTDMPMNTEMHLDATLLDDRIRFLRGRLSQDQVELPRTTSESGSGGELLLAFCVWNVGDYGTIEAV